MASDHTPQPSPSRRWVSGAAAGLIAAFVTGLMVQFSFDPAVLSEGIPSAIGMGGFLAGWIVMLVLGIILGLVYAGIGRAGPLTAYTHAPNTGGIIGLAYGLLLWVAAGIIVPLSFGAPGLQIGEYAVTIHGVLAYALFGVLIGIGYTVGVTHE